MKQPTADKRLWRIGELADAAGMTVRTLHHYEQAGLLGCSGRTEGGHRLYDEADIERLYRVRALRSLGISIDEIKRVMASTVGLADILQTQMHRVEDEVARLMVLRDRLGGIIGAHQSASAENLLATLDAMSHVERYAHEQRRTRAKKNPKENRDAEARWRAVGEELRSCMETGDDPSSPRAQAIALRVRALITAFARGNTALLEALAQLRKFDPPRNLAGWDPALTRYLDDAMATLSEG